MKKQPLFKKQFATWDEWLQYVDEELRKKGYSKFISNNELGADFYYAKTFRDDSKKNYQILIKFYDFRQYNITGDSASDRIGVMFICSPICDSRIDLEVSKKITVDEFEQMAEHFYNAMKTYF